MAAKASWHRNYVTVTSCIPLSVVYFLLCRRAHVRSCISGRNLHAEKKNQEREKEEEEEEEALEKA